MEKVIFLDRDGTLNAEVHYLHRCEDLKLLAGVPEALALLAKAGYKLVVVTNQAGVARGYYKEADVEILHAYMNELLQKNGVQIDAFYYCPHHPEHGIGAYKQVCHCRKPEIGMLKQAETKFSIDKAHSWMIGDKLIDVQAGKNYGVRTVLVGTGYGASEREAAEQAFADQKGKNPLPYDRYAKNLLEAAAWIIKTEEN